MATPSETDFQVTTTGDLVRLCEAAPTDATGIAALHFCHGFAVGAYQYHQIAAAAENKTAAVLRAESAADRATRPSPASSPGRGRTRVR